MAEEIQANLNLAERFQQIASRKARPQNSARSSGALSGFKEFVLRGNVIDMAVGIVVGAAFGTVVSALVRDLLTPLIAAIVSKPNFSGIVFTLNNSRFLIGDFINELIAFILIAAAVYFFVVIPLNRLLNRLYAPAEPTTRPCPECLNEIPIAAKRCGHCTCPL